MTDKAPERIWAPVTWTDDAQKEGDWCNHTKNGTEYIRLDLHEAEVKRLREALVELVDEYCDYMRLNNLGDPEKQHNIKLARQALANKETSE